MRDISHKVTTLRIATAEATLTARPETIAAVRERRVPKGDALELSKAAAVMAAKNTSQVIPYCHPILVEHVAVEYDMTETSITVRATVKAVQKTGVEMEAMTAAAAGALNLYDLLKMIDDDGMEITRVRLLEKRGGKSDWKSSFARAPRAVVVVVSDSVAAGKKEDRAGKRVVERLEEAGLDVAEYVVMADEPAPLAERLRGFADRDGVALVLTTGGTGFSRRDRTPEAMDEVIEREAPGVMEAARAYGQDRLPWSMLSRGRAGLRGETLFVNLPGSRGGAEDTLTALMPALLHALKIARIDSGGH